MTRPIRLGLFAASPVHYQVPLYRMLAANPRVDFTAVFASDEGARRPCQDGYGAPVEWAVDMLSGYRSIFLRKAGRNPSGGPTFALCDLDVVGQVRRGGYDVLWIHGYHTVTHMLAALAQRASGRPVLYREEQTLLSRRPRWKTLAKSVVLRRLLRSSYGLYIGAQNRLWFERWGLPPGRLFHAPYAVDNEALQSMAQELAPGRARLRAQFGLPSDQPVILTVGRLIEKKQPLLVVEAFARLRRTHLCSLLVAGSGPLEGAMRAKVEGDAVPDVAFAGFVDQTAIGRAYAAADVFTLFSSHDETWGVVVNEAMNFGLPMVLSDQVGSAVDLVREGENGFVVDHRDPGALERALAMLVSDSQKRSRFGEASRRIVADWTYEKAAAAIVEAASRAAARPGRPPSRTATQPL